MFPSGRSRSLLLAAALTLLVAGVLAFASATPAAAQDPEAALHEQMQRIEVLQRHLHEYRERHEACARERDEEGMLACRVMMDAIEMALNVERGLLQRLRRNAHERPHIEKPEHPDRPDRPEPAEKRASAVAIMKKLIELERKAEALEREGRVDEARKLGALYDELAEEHSRVLNGMLKLLQGEARDHAMQLIGAIREAWTNGRREAALELAAKYDQLVAEATKHLQQPREGAEKRVNLREAVEHLYKLDRARHEAEEAGRHDEAEKLQREFDQVGERIGGWIERQLDRLGEDARGKAHGMLERLGDALTEGRLDAAHELAGALQKLFDAAGGGNVERPEHPEMDGRRTRELAELARKAEEVARHLAEVESRMAELDAQLRRAADRGAIDQTLQLLDERAALNEKLNELRAHQRELKAALERGHAGGDKPRDQPREQPRGDDQVRLLEKLLAMTAESEALRAKLQELERAGRRDGADELRKRLAEMERMVEDLRNRLRR